MTSLVPFCSLFICASLLQVVVGSATPRCQNYVTTSLGDILIVDKGMYFYESTAYCAKRNMVLAPVRRQEDIDTLSNYLHPDRECWGSNEWGNFTRVGGSPYYSYRVGLRTVNGSGNWTDNVPFDEAVHGDVFLNAGWMPGESSVYGKGCETTQLDPDLKKLWSFYCYHRPWRFLCWQQPNDKKGKQTTTKLPLHTSTQPPLHTRTKPPLDGNTTVNTTVTASLVLLFLVTSIVFIVRAIMRKRQKNGIAQQPDIEMMIPIQAPVLPLPQNTNRIRYFEM